MTRLSVLFLAAALLCAGGVSAQSRDRGRAAGPSEDAAAIASGWNALAARQYASAVQSADAILKRRPWDRAAIVLKIHASSAMSATRGLDVYEQWLGAARSDEPGLLEPIAIAVLREIAANTTDSELQRSALAALVTSQVEGAAQQLRSTPGGDLALTTPSPDESALLQMLQNPDGTMRANAAHALGAYHSDRARVALQAVAKDPDPRVRTNATVALAKLGDPDALTGVDRMLASDVPEVQLAAVDAWDGRPGPWVEVVRALLTNPDGLVRVNAARAIAKVDPAAARAVLAATLDDGNPVMRAEAAAALETVDVRVGSGDVMALRKRLRDADPVVRAAAAKVLLRLVRT
jgi:HEAT repeat protein